MPAIQDHAGRNYKDVVASVSRLSFSHPAKQVHSQLPLHCLAEGPARHFVGSMESCLLASCDCSSEVITVDLTLNFLMSYTFTCTRRLDRGSRHALQDLDCNLRSQKGECMDSWGKADVQRHEMPWALGAFAPCSERNRTSALSSGTIESIHLPQTSELPWMPKSCGQLWTGGPRRNAWREDPRHLL